MTTRRSSLCCRAPWRAVVVVVALIAAGVRAATAAAQDLSQVAATATPGEPAVLRFNNRPITVLRATILSRSAAERTVVAARVLEDLVEAGNPGPVSTRVLAGVNLVSVGDRDVFTIIALDVDVLAGETQAGKAAAAVTHLQQAVDEAIELRTSSRILKAAALALLATAIFALLLRVAVRLHRVLVVWSTSNAERRLHQMKAGEVLAKASRAHDVVRHTVNVGFGVLTPATTPNYQLPNVRTTAGLRALELVKIFSTADRARDSPREARGTAGVCSAF